jgi:hypothetical protein
MEQTILKFVQNCYKNRAHREWTRKGHSEGDKTRLQKDWWGCLDDARSHIEKVILRQVTTRSRLLEALRQMASETGTTIPSDVMEILESMKPHQAATLMGVYCYVRPPKSPNTSTPKGDSSDDESTPGTLDDED